MKRTIFWTVFLVILALIVWGLATAMNKTPKTSEHANPAAVTSSDHILGTTTAPVTLIEYGDFQCPACKTYFPYVERLMNESSTTLRLVFRHFPLAQHANAVPAALASEAAGLQGKFWEMYRLLYENQAEWSEVSDSASIFEKYALQIGLDVAKFKVDLKNSLLVDHVNSDRDEGAKIGINATPSFFINDKFVQPQSYESFKALIDAAATASAK